MKLQVTHDTLYDYVPGVDIAQHVVYLQPCNTALQTLISHELAIDPLPEHQIAMQDVFGNTRQFFSLQTSHAHLQIVAHSVIQTQAPPPARSFVSWEQVREQFRYSSDSHFDSAAEFVFASPYIPRDDAFADYARASFASGVSLIDAASDLMQRIHTDFIYESKSTQVDTPALEALAQRKGVCQDFAHILIACLRAMGVAARYVSGYLLTHPAAGQARLIGSDASHAWAAVYLPDLPGASCAERWYDLDPTNNRAGWGAPGEDYVTLALGRDYGDVSPVRGVIHGGANHTLNVGVTVEPLESWGSQSQSQYTTN